MRSRLLKIGLPLLALLGIASSAFAYWTTQGSGSAVATVGTLSAPADVTAATSAGSPTVSLSWTGSTLSGGTPAEGYYVTRTNTSSSTTSAACGSSAASLISETSCSDTSVPDGPYTYTVVAVYRSWSAASTASNQVTVQGDTTPPSATVAASSPSPANTQPLTYAVTFSEPVSDLTAAGITVAAPPANTSVAKSVSKTDSQHFTVSVTGLKMDGTGDGTVSVQVNANAVKDLAGNDNGASNTAGVTWDRTTPTRTALEFLDASGNGKVDQVRVTYNESLGSYAAGTSPWTLANVPSGGSLSTVHVSGSVVTLNLTEGSGAANTAAGSFTVAYAAPGAGGVTDAAGNGAASFSATAVSDSAPPALTALEMLDTNTNGKVNQLKATFSENLAAYSAGTAPWTLASVPSGGSLSSVSVSGTIATLTLTEGAAAADTAVGSFTAALGASATGIRDAAGNKSSFTAQVPADKAGPVPTALVDTDGSNNGKLEQNDTMTVTFSENATGVGVSSNVVLTGGNGSNNDSIAMSNLLNAATSLGRSDYISGNGSTANFNSSVVSQPAANQVRVTLAACTGACASLPATGAGGAGNFSFTPATTITDAAGNPAAGSITVSIRLF